MIVNDDATEQADTANLISVARNPASSHYLIPNHAVF
jgi:hypothetical protein